MAAEREKEKKHKNNKKKVAHNICEQPSFIHKKARQFYN